MLLSRMVSTLQPSRIQVMAELSRRAVAEGRDVIDMTLGEPDFSTPEHICEAAMRAIRAGQTRYTPINGSVRLREAIVEKFSRDNGINTTPAEISVGCGGKQVIYQAMLASLNEHDEVLMPAPYWASYDDIVRMNGGLLRAIMTTPEQGYEMRPEQLEAAITARTKWLILNSPSNPSGTAYTARQLDAFAEVIRHSRNKSFFIMTDDIYEHILFDNAKFATLAGVAPDLQHRILTVNGVSKAYSMTGWRVGYATGPQALIDAMTRIQMQVNSHTSSISQAAALAALEGPQEVVRARCEAFQGRRDLMLNRLAEVEGLRTPRPAGAFYLFPDIRKLIGMKTRDGRIITDDEAFASYLLDEGVAAVPGSGFGMPGFIRLSYATSDPKLQMAATRIKAAIEKLDASVTGT